MSVELWSAILNPRGPNYATWKYVLDSERVPLKSPHPVTAELGGNARVVAEGNVEVYLLDLHAMTLAQRARLVGFIANKFDAPIYEVEAEIAAKGFPIRAVDVIVSFDMRAFA